MRSRFRSLPSAPKVSPGLALRADPAGSDLTVAGPAVSGPATLDPASPDSVADPQPACCWVIAHPNGTPYGRTRTWLGRPRRERHYRTKPAAVAAIWRLGPDAIAVARAARLTTSCRSHTRADRTLLAG
jgi:hypothetical protein